MGDYVTDSCLPLSDTEFNFGGLETDDLGFVGGVDLDESPLDGIVSSLDPTTSLTTNQKSPIRYSIDSILNEAPPTEPKQKICRLCVSESLKSAKCTEECENGPPTQPASPPTQPLLTPKPTIQQYEAISDEEEIIKKETSPDGATFPVKYNLDFTPVKQATKREWAPVKITLEDRKSPVIKPDGVRTDKATDSPVINRDKKVAKLKSNVASTNKATSQFAGQLDNDRPSLDLPTRPSLDSPMSPAEENQSCSHDNESTISQEHSLKLSGEITSGNLEDGPVINKSTDSESMTIKSTDFSGNLGTDGSSPVKSIDDLSNIDNAPVKLIDTPSNLDNKPVKLIDASSNLDNKPVKSIDAPSNLVNAPVKSIDGDSNLDNAHAIEPAKSKVSSGKLDNNKLVKSTKSPVKSRDREKSSVKMYKERIPLKLSPVKVTDVSINLGNDPVKAEDSAVKFTDESSNLGNDPVKSTASSDQIDKNNTVKPIKIHIKSRKIINDGTPVKACLKASSVKLKDDSRNLDDSPVKSTLKESPLKLIDDSSNFDNSPEGSTLNAEIPVKSSDSSGNITNTPVKSTFESNKLDNDFVQATKDNPVKLSEECSLDNIPVQEPVKTESSAGSLDNSPVKTDLEAVSPVNAADSGLGSSPVQTNTEESPVKSEDISSKLENDPVKSATKPKFGRKPIKPREYKLNKNPARSIAARSIPVKPSNDETVKSEDGSLVKSGKEPSLKDETPVKSRKVSTSSKLDKSPVQNTEPVKLTDRSDTPVKSTDGSDLPVKSRRVSTSSEQNTDLKPVKSDSANLDKIPVKSRKRDHDLSPVKSKKSSTRNNIYNSPVQNTDAVPVKSIDKPVKSRRVSTCSEPNPDAGPVKSSKIEHSLKSLVKSKKGSTRSNSPVQNTDAVPVKSRRVSTEPNTDPSPIKSTKPKRKESNKLNCTELPVKTNKPKPVKSFSKTLRVKPSPIKAVVINTIFRNNVIKIKRSQIEDQKEKLSMKAKPIIKASKPTKNQPELKQTELKLSVARPKCYECSVQIKIFTVSDIFENFSAYKSTKSSTAWLLPSCSVKLDRLKSNQKPLENIKRKSDQQQKPSNKRKKCKY